MVEPLKLRIHSRGSGVDIGTHYFRTYKGALAAAQKRLNDTSHYLPVYHIFIEARIDGRVYWEPVAIVMHDGTVKNRPDAVNELKKLRDVVAAKVYEIEAQIDSLPAWS